MPKRIQPLLLACTGIGLVLVPFAAPAIEPNPKNISLFLETYCLKCHSGEKVKGKVDFGTVSVTAASKDDFDFWQLAAEVVDYEDMPPEDE